MLLLYFYGKLVLIIKFQTRTYSLRKWSVSKILIFCILLWIFAIILIVTNPRNNAIRLSGLMAFFVGCGGLADVILYQVIPITSSNINQDFRDTIKLAAGILNSLAYYGAPYLLLIFSIYYSEILILKRKWVMYIIFSVLLLPIVSMYVFFPIHPIFQPPLWHVCLLAVPYFFLSDYLLIYGAVRAKDPYIKEQRLLTCILLVPLASLLFIINYIGPVYGLLGKSLAYCNDTIGIFTLLGFILLAAKYGVLGIKIDAFNINNQMKIATLGTNMLNHSLKNEVAKVKICINNIESYIEPNQITTDSLQIIDDSFNHIFNMMSRIQEKTKAIVLIEEPCNLRNVIEHSLSEIKPLFQNRDIEINNKVDPEIILLADKVHLDEVMSNIFRNAIEAIPSSKTGRINVESKWRKKQIIVEIRDNGSGIDKELLPCIFEPFFSTKHPDNNFGLGLPYSLNVLQKSGGTIEVQSEINHGTAVLLKFPITKLVS